jgi:hypothetical protein
MVKDNLTKWIDKMHSEEDRYPDTVIEKNAVDMAFDRMCEGMPVEKLDEGNPDRGFQMKWPIEKMRALQEKLRKSFDPRFFEQEINAELVPVKTGIAVKPPLPRIRGWALLCDNSGAEFQIHPDGLTDEVLGRLAAGEWIIDGCEEVAVEKAAVGLKYNIRFRCKTAADESRTDDKKPIVIGFI